MPLALAKLGVPIRWSQCHSDPIAVMLGIAFTLMGELKFFIPFRVVIWKTYSAYILAY